MTFLLVIYLLFDLIFIGLFSYWISHDFEYKWIYHELDKYHLDFIKQPFFRNAFVNIYF